MKIVAPKGKVFAIRVMVTPDDSEIVVSEFDVTPENLVDYHDEIGTVHVGRAAYDEYKRRLCKAIMRDEVTFEVGYIVHESAGVVADDGSDLPVEVGYKDFLLAA